jgi:hypothetical protein
LSLTTTIRNWLSRLESALALRKDSIGVIKDIFTILALIVGGIWTWMLFSSYRESYPRMSIEHRIAHRRLSNDQILLIIDVNASNTGKVVVKPVVGWFAIDQILPLATEQLDRLKVGELHPSWTSVVSDTWFRGLDLGSEHYLEPGETETYHQELILRSSATTLRVYTFFSGKPTVVAGGQMAPHEATRSSPGWGRYSVYDLQESGKVSCTEAAQARACCAPKSLSGKPPRVQRSSCRCPSAATPLHH